VGKLAHLAAVKHAKAESFVYAPPLAAFDATRILVKPGLGHPAAPPETVSVPVLGAVLRGLRRANPGARIVIVTGASTGITVEQIFTQGGVLDLLDDNMRAADADAVGLREYPNLLQKPFKYTTMLAPAYIGDYDCRISVASFKRTMGDGQPIVAAALKNLFGLFPRAHYAQPGKHFRSELYRPDVADVLKDVYFTIGHLFDGAVMDLSATPGSDERQPAQGESVPVGQVVWGDDLLAVDEAAYRLAGEPVAGYITEIRALCSKMEQR
jgi:uncharacterized protein (DUF362 family)